MAIKTYGIPQNINAVKWAKLFQRLGELHRDEGVTGMAPTIGTGTRLVRIATGDAIAAGTLAESDSIVDVTLDANDSGQPRIDVITAQVDWSGTVDTAGTIFVVKGAPGATPQVPTLTRTAGGKWQQPIAQVLVRAGVGQLLDTDLTDVRWTGLPVCKLRQTSTQPFANEVATRTVTLDAKEIDTDRMADLAANAIRIRHAGLYRLTGRVQFRDAANGYRRGEVAKNGNPLVYDGVDANDTSGLGTTLNLAETFDLAAGDVLTLRCLHSQGTTTSTQVSGGYYSMLQAEMVR